MTCGWRKSTVALKVFLSKYDQVESGRLCVLEKRESITNKNKTEFKSSEHINEKIDRP